jgi:hypothetical protein
MLILSVVYLHFRVFRLTLSALEYVSLPVWTEAGHPEFKQKHNATLNA